MTSSGFLCTCGDFTFDRDNSPIRNGLVAYNDYTLTHLLLNNLKTDVPRTKFHEVMDAKSHFLNSVKLLLVCPKCGRIHIFWNDRLIVTYQPEFETRFNEEDSQSEISVPYVNKEIEDELIVYDD